MSFMQNECKGELIDYREELKEAVFTFTDTCFKELRKAFEPSGRHDYYQDIPAQFDWFGCLMDEDRLIGTVGLKRLDESTVELKTMYLQREYRGRGLGYGMLSAALDKARKAGYRRMVLDSISSYHAALRLYERNGFRSTERYNNNVYADVFMEKEL